MTAAEGGSDSGWAGPEHREVEATVLTVDGADLEVAITEPPGENNSHGILFLHGLGGDHRSWRAQMQRFGAGYRCGAWTMPGYGRSAPPAATGFAALADSAAALIAQLEWSAPTVVGHSMGGYVAQELALRYPESVGSLVLAGTTSAFGKPGSNFNRQFLADRLAPLDQGHTPADLAPGVVENLVGPNTDDEVRRSAVESMSTISSQAYRRALETLVTWNATERLPALDRPTLCIAGEVDGTAPPRAMERLSGAVDGSQLLVLPRVGHLMYAEAREPFNAAVADFVDRIHGSHGRRP